MLLYRIILMAMMAVFISGCASKNVDWDYDPDQSLSHLKNYTWLEKEKELNEFGYLSDALEDQRVQSSVDNIMQARGYRKVSSAGEADFLINYSTQVQSRIEGQPLSTSFGFSRRGYGVGLSNDNIIREYDEGTLTLDFIDPDTKKVLWRGRSRSRVQNKLSPQQRTERVNQSVMDILQGFQPPASPLFPVPH